MSIRPDHLLAEQAVTPDGPVSAHHPVDSSRLLLGLMQLSLSSGSAFRDETEDDLSGAIPRDVLRCLLSALHFRDVSTVRHVRRVAALAVGVGRYLSWDAPQLRRLEVAALLHDIGKIGVPDNILFKPGKLAPNEAELMALHHSVGLDVLQAARVHQEVLDIVVQAHGQYNPSPGTAREAGGRLHQGARILAVADAYDSMATDQVYRAGRPHEQIMEVLVEASGTQFDGNVVCALSRWINAEGIPFQGERGESSLPEAMPRQASPADALEASQLGHIFSYLYLLESLYDGFYLVDNDLKIVVWNRGMVDLLGHPASKVLGQGWSQRLFEFQDPGNRPLADAAYPLHQVVAAGRGSTTPLYCRHADGSDVQIEVQSVPLIDASGQLHGVAEIFRSLSRGGRQTREIQELRLAASRDPLTGVANRGELETQLAIHLQSAGQSESGERLSVIFLDVDFFKKINDTHGHSVGDNVLIDMTRLLQQETYSGEHLGRYGGEEFVILCPDTDMQQAVRRAERLRTAICQAEIGGLPAGRITASFGVAEYEAGDSVESLLRHADRALYAAKDSGRNCTCSLSSRETADNSSNEDGDSTATNPFQFETRFFALVAADMIVFKLRGFVTDHRARLQQVELRRAVLRVGRVGLLPFWGSSHDRQPIEVEICFGDEQMAQRGSTASRQVEVVLRIHPLGWIRDSAVFQQRARNVARIIRAYFVA